MRKCIRPTWQRPSLPLEGTVARVVPRACAHVGGGRARVVRQACACGCACTWGPWARTCGAASVHVWACVRARGVRGRARVRTRAIRLGISRCKSPRPYGPKEIRKVFLDWSFLLSSLLISHLGLVSPRRRVRVFAASSPLLRRHRPVGDVAQLEKIQT